MRIRIEHRIVHGMITDESDLPAQLDALAAEGFRVHTYQAVPMTGAAGVTVPYGVALAERVVEVQEEEDGEPRGMRMRG